MFMMINKNGKCEIFTFRVDMTNIFVNMISFDHIFYNLLAAIVKSL